MKVCTQLDLNCICCEEMNREKRIKFSSMVIKILHLEILILSNNIHEFSCDITDEH